MPPTSISQQKAADIAGSSELNQGQVAPSRKSFPLCLIQRCGSSKYCTVIVGLESALEHYLLPLCKAGSDYPALMTSQVSSEGGCPTACAALPALRTQLLPPEGRGERSQRVRSWVWAGLG